MTAAALAITLPYSAQADEARVVDIAAIGQGINSNLERLQQYASTVQQYQTQLGQLHRQLVDAAQPGLELYVKAQQTWQGLQQVQRIFENGSLYLRQLGDLNYYRAHVSGDANQTQATSTSHLQRHH
jgi:conjugal transfer/entry exclusion protein